MEKKENPIIKIDLAENWAKAKNYIPDDRTIIIYNYNDGTQRIKIGNGTNRVGELPFIGIDNSNSYSIEDDILIIK